MRLRSQAKGLFIGLIAAACNSQPSAMAPPAGNDQSRCPVDLLAPSDLRIVHVPGRANCEVVWGEAFGRDDVSFRIEPVSADTELLNVGFRPDNATIDGSRNLGCFGARPLPGRYRVTATAEVADLSVRAEAIVAVDDAPEEQPLTLRAVRRDMLLLKGRAWWEAAACINPQTFQDPSATRRWSPVADEVNYLPELLSVERIGGITFIGGDLVAFGKHPHVVPDPDTKADWSAYQAFAWDRAAIGYLASDRCARSPRERWQIPQIDPVHAAHSPPRVGDDHHAGFVVERAGQLVVLHVVDHSGRPRTEEVRAPEGLRLPTTTSIGSRISPAGYEVVFLANRDDGEAQLVTTRFGRNIDVRSSDLGRHDLTVGRVEFYRSGVPAWVARTAAGELLAGFGARLSEQCTRPDMVPDAPFLGEGTIAWQERPGADVHIGACSKPKFIEDSPFICSVSSRVFSSSLTANRR